MNQEISSLMDGELEPLQAERTIRACGQSEDLKDTWNLYHVIGDALRGQAPRALARDAGVMQALEKQPTVLAPPRRRIDSTVGRVALAAAASVATIGVVGWIGMQGGPGTPSQSIATGAPANAIKPVAATAAVPPASQPGASAPVIEVQDYLAAHRQIPSPDLYRPAANRAAAGAR